MMKRSLLVVGVLVALLASGCGGGGASPPTTYDLTVLQGVWDNEGTLNGEISNTGVNMPIINGIEQDVLTITTNSINDQKGRGPYTWSYDGATLQVEYTESKTFVTMECEVFTMDLKWEFSANMNASTTTTSFTGTVTGSGTSGFCGDLDYTATYNGNLTKQ